MVVALWRIVSWQGRDKIFPRPPLESLVISFFGGGVGCAPLWFETFGRPVVVSLQVALHTLVPTRGRGRLPPGAGANHEDDILDG